MVDDLDLFLYHRHPAGEVVVLPDFPRQLVNAGLHDGLCFLIGQQYTHQRNAAGDDCDNDFIHDLSSMYVVNFEFFRANE